MELRRILWPAAGVVITMLVLVLPASVPASGQAPEIVAAHTSGRISTRDSIRVRFVPEMDAAPIDRPLAANPFRFEPGIDGQALWRDARTLIFRPHKPLPPGRAYRATLDLAALAAPGEAAAFSFDFATLRQSFDIRIGRLQAASGSDMKRLHLPGEIRTADVAAAAQVMQLLTAQQAGQGRNISWTHTDQGRTHRFLVKNILRGKGASALVLQWDGTSIGAQQKGTSRVEIPPLGPFQALDARAIRGRTQYIDLHFSDPLQKDQDLGGLIRIDGHRGLRFTVEGNGVRVYSERPWSGEITLRIATGVRNALGQRLVGPKDFTLNFAPEKPQVRFMGKGVIIPTSQGLTLPVETVNLRALTVEALRVNEQNLPQFLQVNNLDGERQLRRVGRVVWKQTLPLEVTAENADQWVRHGLDLTPLVKAHPHGLYRLRLTFQRPHIIYPCAGDPALPPAATEAQGPGSQNQPATTSYWDGWDEGFDRRNWYRERHNPCHPAYYQDWHDRNFEAARNVLVSDMGLTAKQGADDQLLVVATDLKSARPLEKVKIRLFNYQQEEIAQGSTGRDGMARIGYEMAPFLVVAEKNGQTGYLRLDNGAALSVSHFDVAGQEVEAGIKGFLYAERGVWRPGDPIYLTFILRDDSGRLPTDHPVVFELRNPRGQLVHRLTRSQSLNGFFTFPTRTAADAPTGNWNVRVRVGGASFEKTLKIETVRPNRLKIGLDFGPHTTALSGGRLQGKLSAAWLHGAVAKHLKADIEVAFSTRPTRFAGYEEYAFDDPARTYNPESQTIFEGTLDAKGQTLFTAEVATENLSPGMLTAQFNTRVFEPGGAFSIDRYSLPYHPYARYVGLRLPKGDQARGMLLTDTDHIVRLAALNRKGHPLPQAEVEVELYKIKWRWWWETGREAIADYIGESNYRPIRKETVPLKDGRGQWTLRIDYPEWGRYLVRVRDKNGRHIAGKIVYIDWPGWAGRGQKDIPGGASVLSFAADQPAYEVGQTVTVTIPVSRAGRGLVSIENGSRVLRSEWIQAQGDAVRYQFKATADMAPNVYVHVSLLQPHRQTVNDLPIRMYGVIPVKITDPQTVLQPLIETPETFVPETTATVSVREAAGRPMTYTLAIVDEGLLDLTRFATPDPWTHFNRREALGVKTWDLFDDVVGAYGGTLKQLLAIGGDDALAVDQGKQKANRFPPMVRFYGPFDLPAGQTLRHTVDIPRYIGSVRVMVVAGQARAFGRRDVAVPVRKPLMVLGTLPRVLGPEETVDLPVSVFALESTVQQVSLTIATEGALAVAGADTRSLAFAQPGDDLVTFRLKAGARTGIARVTIRAASGDVKATHEIELDVRPPGGPVVNVTALTLESQGDRQETITLPGMVGTNRATLEISRVPPLNLGRRLGFLIRYPHGCVEQITSAVFPQLYLGRLRDMPPEYAVAVEGNIKAGIDRLRRFQTPDGGFGYWPGADQAQDWSTSYAGHFLVEAQRIGYLLPAGLREAWQGYQRRRAAEWTPGTARAALDQAYRLYTLALAGAAEMGAMNRLRERADLDPAARWRLAAAYQMAGQPEAAEALTRRLSTAVAPYKELANTYGSDLRDRAMILETLVLMNALTEAHAVARDISAALGDQRWMSTQTTAYALIAMARYASIAGQGRETEAYFRWNADPEAHIVSAKPLVQIPLAVSGRRDGTLSLRNPGEGLLFARVVSQGLPAPGKETAAHNGFALEVDYLTTADEPLDPSKIGQGSDFIVQVTVENTGLRGRYEEVALTQIFPSGWEIHHQRMDNDDADIPRVDYQDIRDDRVLTYFDLAQGETLTLRTRLNASYIGRYYLPMVTVETMYDATINARRPGRWVAVVKPGEELP